MNPVDFQSTDHVRTMLLLLMSGGDAALALEARLWFVIPKMSFALIQGLHYLCSFYFLPKCLFQKNNQCRQACRLAEQQVLIFNF